jgi:hypothetical protein
MGLFGKSGNREKIYLTVVETKEGEVKEGCLRILFCDDRGTLSTSDIDRAYYERLAATIDEIGREDKSCAAILVVSDGQPDVTYILEISARQARTLDKILHAVYDSEEVPKVFNAPLKEIIKLARTKIKLFTTLSKDQADDVPCPEVPGIHICLDQQ